MERIVPSLGALPMAPVPVNLDLWQSLAVSGVAAGPQAGAPLPLALVSDEQLLDLPQRQLPLPLSAQGHPKLPS